MVFIWILKALACVLTLVLLVLLTVLFVPVRYKLNAEYSEKIGVYLKASWLLRMFVLIYDTEVNPAVKLKILGRTGKNKRKSKSGSEAGNKKRKKSEEKAESKQKSTKQKPAKQKSGSNEKGFKGWDKKELWRNFKDYPYKEPLIRKTLLFTKRLIKALLPSQADGECRFGFDDPGATGALLGAAHTVLGITNLYGHICVSGDFEKEYLYLKCNIAGKITLWSLCWPFAAYALSRPVWIIIKPMIFKKKTKG